MAAPSDEEFAKALASSEVQALLSRTEPLLRSEIERELGWRRPEMAFETAKARDARTAARRSLHSAEAEISASVPGPIQQEHIGLASLAVFLLFILLLALVFDAQWPKELFAFGQYLDRPWWVYAAWLAVTAALVLIVRMIVTAAFVAPKLRRRLSAEKDLPTLEAVATAAEVAYDERLGKVVASHVTESINLRSSPVYADAIHVAVSSEIEHAGKLATIGVGLAEVAQDENIIPTEPHRRIIEMVERLPGGSIGISGPRGVGKSTLLSSVCKAHLALGNRSVIAVATAAPVEYQARDFLLHLFASLCRRVLDIEVSNRALVEKYYAEEEMRDWLRSSWRARVQPLARLLALTSIVMIIAALVIAAISAVVASRAEESEAANSSIASEQTIRDAYLLVRADQWEKIAAEVKARSDVAKAEEAKAKAAREAVAAKAKAAAAQSGAGTTAGASAKSRTGQAPAGEQKQAPETSAASNTEPDAAAAPRVPFPIGITAAPFATLGLAAALLLVILMMWESRFQFGRSFAWPLGPRKRDEALEALDEARNRAIAETSAKELCNIRFQRSYTSGWSGAVKVPAGLDLGATGGITLQQQAESLPELVERFRAYVGKVAATYGAVIFGIDELDKLKSAGEGEAFLNGVKSVFGIPNCFYLISVSEDALSAFDRRGIGIRDAFDSALDEILHVDFLDLAQARTLLGRRILRLPDPYLQLCHMLSGGLPRDLIRHARQLLETAMHRKTMRLTLKSAIHTLVTADLRAKLRATEVAIKGLKELPQTNSLLREIARLSAQARLPRQHMQVEAFQKHLESIARLSDEDRRLARLADELRVYFDTMILVRRVGELLSEPLGWQIASQAGLADLVARVRQALEVSVPLAENRLASTRAKIGLAETRLAKQSSSEGDDTTG